MSSATRSQATSWKVLRTLPLFGSWNPEFNQLFDYKEIKAQVTWLVSWNSAFFLQNASYLLKLSYLVLAQF